MSDKPYLCIVGTAESTTRKIPTDDPLAIVWGVGSAYDRVTKCAAWFEMHGDVVLASQTKEVPAYDAFLRASGFPIFMTHPREQYPASRAFPREEIAAHFGIEYFRSSFDYMLSLAILHIEAPDSQFRPEIRLFGIDMHEGAEYDHQLPSASFYLGWAMAKGIKLVIPKSSSLLHAPSAYGYDVGLPGEDYPDEGPADERIRELGVQTEYEKKVAMEAQLKHSFTAGQAFEAALWKRRGARF